MRINSLILSQYTQENLDNLLMQDQNRDGLQDAHIDNVSEMDERLEENENKLAPIIEAEEASHGLHETQIGNIEQIDGNGDASQSTLIEVPTEDNQGHKIIKDQILKEQAVIENIAGLLGHKYNNNTPASFDMYNAVNNNKVTPFTVKDLHMESYNSSLSPLEEAKILYRTHVENFSGVAKALTTTATEGIKTFYNQVLKFIKEVMNNLGAIQKTMEELRDKYYNKDNSNYSLEELKDKDEINGENLLIDCTTRHDLVNNAIALMEMNFTNNPFEELKGLKPLKFKTAKIDVEDNSDAIITLRGICGVNGESQVQSINIQFNSPKEAIDTLVDIAFEGITLLKASKKLEHLQKSLEENLRKISNSENKLESPDGMRPTKYIANVLSMVRAVSRLPKTYLDAMQKIDSILKTK